jgi:hypothetical protein
LAFEAPTVVSGLDDIAVVGQAIVQRGRHIGLAEDAGPFTESQVGADDNEQATMGGTSRAAATRGMARQWQAGLSVVSRDGAAITQ